MRCSCCNKPMHKAAVTVRKQCESFTGATWVDVLVYGPKCAARLGLIPAQQQAAKTQHRTIKRVAKGAFLNRTFEAQKGQVELFEGFTV